MQHFTADVSVKNDLPAQKWALTSSLANCKDLINFGPSQCETVEYKHSGGTNLLININSQSNMMVGQIEKCLCLICVCSRSVSVAQQSEPSAGVHTSSSTRRSSSL